MNSTNQSEKSRRQFLKTSALTAVGLTLSPSFFASGEVRDSRPLLKRTFGKTGFKVTTLGLGGQASIQWTPENTDPVAIIQKAYHLGINYFDTSNVYGPSQMNYGKAFRQLGLVPETPNYDPARRSSIFLTSKTMLRFGKGGDDRPDVVGHSNGPAGSKASDDVRRSLSQIFGDGNGSYPKEAWLDMVLIHNLNRTGEVDALYEGYANPDPNAKSIGALAALRDLRDGTNRTGLNPRQEKLIRHVGFSGHNDAEVMIDMIQRDTENLLDGMLIAINANDQNYFNMQHNVIPVAAAKNMAIIAMKVFADGAMYTKKAEWSNKVAHVVQQVSSNDLPASDLIRYSLSTPGIHTAIIGIGQISDNPDECQLSYNLKHAQILPDSLSDKERARIEKLAFNAKEGKTNYFQRKFQDLSAPVDAKALKAALGVIITWHTAYAGDAAIDRYEIWRSGKKIASIPFEPQTTRNPFQYLDKHSSENLVNYQVKVVDKKGRMAESEVQLT